MQESLFQDSPESAKSEARSGTFTDNMRLPIHRWYRYSAGFSAEWADSVIRLQASRYKGLRVLDPFVGSGTTLLVADAVGVRSIGVEAHPFICRVSSAKLSWPESVEEFIRHSRSVLECAKRSRAQIGECASLIRRCFADDVLAKLYRLRTAWESQSDNSSASVLVWLAITAILRSTASVGTAQCQYVLPNKKKKHILEPFLAFQSQVDVMCRDMWFMQSRSRASGALLLDGDARSCPELPNSCIDLVVTSPPYANNFDYADSTRLEMTFWGDVSTWGDLHEAVRKYLICSNSQHASKEKWELNTLLQDPYVKAIKPDIEKRCNELSVERLRHGGKKHYHTMVAGYFADMGKVWHELRRVCKPGAKLCFVIGDSAPYGVHIPVEGWLGELALASGFVSYSFEKIRDRNVKWKNRKHRVRLHEGRLWVCG